MTMTELAGRLKVRRETLRKRWRSWGLTGIKTGREWRFRPADVARWETESAQKGELW